MDLMKRLLIEEDGQGMVEYALILALISVVAIAVLVLYAGPLTEIFEDVLAKLTI